MKLKHHPDFQVNVKPLKIICPAVISCNTLEKFPAYFWSTF